MEQKELITGHDEASADNDLDLLGHASGLETSNRPVSLKESSSHHQSLEPEETEDFDEAGSGSDVDTEPMLEHRNSSDTMGQAPAPADSELVPEDKSSRPPSVVPQHPPEVTEKVEEVGDAGESDEESSGSHISAQSEQMGHVETFETPLGKKSRPRTEEVEALNLPKLTRHTPAVEHRDSRALSTSSGPEELELESESEPESDESEEYIRTRTPRGSLASISEPVESVSNRASELPKLEESEQPQRPIDSIQGSSVSSPRGSLLSSGQDVAGEQADSTKLPRHSRTASSSTVASVRNSIEPQGRQEVDAANVIDLTQEQEIASTAVKEVPDDSETTIETLAAEEAKPFVQPGIALDETPEPRPESLATPETRPAPPSPTARHNSMVTVRLSEPDGFDENMEHSGNVPPRHVSQDAVAETRPTLENIETTNLNTRGSLATLASRKLSSSTLRKSRSDQGSSDSEEEVDWDHLERTEDEQAKDEDTDNSTALLLARLDEEKAKLAGNPKSVKVTPSKSGQGKRPRPPSIAQLRQMIDGPTPSALRYSLVPPPPMTDLEFYAALVKDYQQTAARLPTLLLNKIRKGIPPPLRGVVWQSMSGARDVTLAYQYDRLGGESSPYEPIIGKDLGRSFPGVEMFRETDGDGQRMLGCVLKAFSLHDTKIGYCQGLAFIVGPLLMHMQDKDAFCVLVRLMEQYDLRACFLPDLSGLHVKIYQFRELLRLNLPSLASHLEELQVDPAYVSQWFLSFFAVTCPLPFLFRIYDVVFAEGATETLMRVALALMRKNEPRLIACTELEDVLGLLLSRGLWDCYSYNADAFVQDFVSLTSEVSKEKLSQLEQGYKDTLVATANAARAMDITTAASRFLGRIWAASSAVSPRMPIAVTLSPGLNAPANVAIRPLQRSASKQSLTSTLNSVEATSASITSSTSTDATMMSRDSAAVAESLSRESTPVGSKAHNANMSTAEERYLHSQIEDLLTALSELQRNSALLSNQLQREREERQEDGKAVRSLLDGLRRRAEKDIFDDADATPLAEDDAPVLDEPQSHSADTPPDRKDDTPSTQDLTELLDRVESRFVQDEERNRRSSWVQTKAQLREDLALARDQLNNATTQSQELSRRLEDYNTEMRRLKEQLKESHVHVRSLHQDKQRLEKQIHTARSRASVYSAIEPSNKEPDAEWSNKNAAASGLRELKLARSVSTPTQAGFNKRLSSMSRSNRDSIIPSTPPPPPSEQAVREQESLLSELVQAKTAEAVAKQEAEEAKQRLEAFRKAYGIAPGETPPASLPSLTTAGMLSMFGRLTGQETAKSDVKPEARADMKPENAKETKREPDRPPAEAGHKPSASTSGGFWGWRR